MGPIHVCMEKPKDLVLPSTGTSGMPLDAAIADYPPLESRQGKRADKGQVVDDSSSSSSDSSDSASAPLTNDEMILVAAKKAERMHRQRQATKAVAKKAVHVKAGKAISQRGKVDPNEIEDPHSPIFVDEDKADDVLAPMFLKDYILESRDFMDAADDRYIKLLEEVKKMRAEQMSQDEHRELKKIINAQSDTILAQGAQLAALTETVSAMSAQLKTFFEAWSDVQADDAKKGEGAGEDQSTTVAAATAPKRRTTFRGIPDTQASRMNEKIRSIDQSVRSLVERFTPRPIRTTYKGRNLDFPDMHIFLRDMGLQEASVYHVPKLPKHKRSKIPKLTENQARHYREILRRLPTDPQAWISRLESLEFLANEQQADFLDEFHQRMVILNNLIVDEAVGIDLDESLSREREKWESEGSRRQKRK